MTPNDLDAYLKVMQANHVGAAVVRLPDGTRLQVSFVPPLPEMSNTELTPGGWKSPQHLDDPAHLRELPEYRGELP